MTDLIRCANGCTRDDDTGTPQPVTTRPPARICSRCTRRLAAWLDAIPDLYRRADIHQRPPADEDPDVRRARQAFTPAPVNLAAWSALDASPIWSPTMGCWTTHRRGTLGALEPIADLIRDHHQLMPPKARTVATEIHTIVAYLDWLTTVEHIADTCSETRRIHHELETAVGAHRTHSIGRCPTDTVTKTCGGPLLPTGNGHVHCARCGRHWGPHQLRQLGLMLSTNGAA